MRAAEVTERVTETTPTVEEMLRETTKMATKVVSKAAGAATRVAVGRRAPAKRPTETAMVAEEEPLAAEVTVAQAAGVAAEGGPSALQVGDRALTAPRALVPNA